MVLPINIFQNLKAIGYSDISYIGNSGSTTILLPWVPIWLKGKKRKKGKTKKKQKKNTTLEVACRWGI